MFLFRADAKVRDRHNAAKHFIQWCRTEYGELFIELNKFKVGKIPYGWFAKYVRENEPLKRHCGGSRGGGA